MLPPSFEKKNYLVASHQTAFVYSGLVCVVRNHDSTACTTPPLAMQHVQLCKSCSGAEYFEDAGDDLDSEGPATGVCTAAEVEDFDLALMKHSQPAATAGEARFCSANACSVRKDMTRKTRHLLMPVTGDLKQVGSLASSVGMGAAAQDGVKERGGKAAGGGEGVEANDGRLPVGDDTVVVRLSNPFGSGVVMKCVRSQPAESKTGNTLAAQPTSRNRMFAAGGVGDEHSPRSRTTGARCRGRSQRWRGGPATTETNVSITFRQQQHFQHFPRTCDRASCGKAPACNDADQYPGPKFRKNAGVALIALKTKCSSWSAK